MPITSDDTYLMEEWSREMPDSAIEEFRKRIMTRINDEFSEEMRSMIRLANILAIDFNNSGMHSEAIKAMSASRSMKEILETASKMKED